MIIICPNCKTERPYEEVVQKRPVEGYTAVMEVGILCPECEEWTHSFFVNERLQNLRRKMDKAAALVKVYRDANQGQVDGLDEMIRETMQKQSLKGKSAQEVKTMLGDRLYGEYRKAKGDYGRAFNRFNAMMRKRLGVTPPAELEQTIKQ